MFGAPIIRPTIWMRGTRSCTDWRTGWKISGNLIAAPRSNLRSARVYYPTPIASLRFVDVRASVKLQISPARLRRNVLSDQGGGSPLTAALMLKYFASPPVRWAALSHTFSFAPFALIVLYQKQISFKNRYHYTGYQRENLRKLSYCHWSCCSRLEAISPT